MKQICISLIICAVALAGCKSSKKASSKQMKSGKNKSKNFTEYEEDLSVLRPSYKDSLAILNEASTDKKEDTLVAASVVPQHDITGKINNFLQEVAEREKKYDIRVYTLQLYLGNDRQAAVYIRNKANNIFTESEAKIFFEPPFYKVRMGKFTDRIDAFNELDRAQKVFKNVSVIPIHLKAAEL